MAENNLTNTMDSLMKGMNSVLSTKTVVGEPTVIGDTIIIPLVDVSFGCAAGANLNATDKKNASMGSFWGKESPSAILIIKNGQSKLVTVKNHDTISKILELVPELIDKFTSPKEEMPSDEVAKDIAFPEESN